MVKFEDRRIKYGVIRTDRLITDLLDWDTLYVSGRLHKPVKMLIQPTNQDLIQVSYNYTSFLFFVHFLLLWGHLVPFIWGLLDIFP